MQEENIDIFLQRLSRLKHELRVSKDKEVAKFLGLADKAFNARKARNSFPERELIALAEARPELGLNLDFILDGTPPVTESKDDAEKRLKRTNYANALVRALPLPELAREQLAAVMSGDPAQDAALIAYALIVTGLPDDEQALLAAYRRCAVPARQTLMQTAELLAGPVAPIVAARAKSTKKSGRPSPMSIVVEASTVKREV